MGTGQDVVTANLDIKAGNVVVVDLERGEMFCQCCKVRLSRFGSIEIDELLLSSPQFIQLLFCFTLSKGYI